MVGSGDRILPSYTLMFSTLQLIAPRVLPKGALSSVM